MNRRILVLLVLVSATSLLHAQDKATPTRAAKGDKSGDNPKILTFQPDAATPTTVRPTPAPRATRPDPLLDGPAQIVDTFFTTLKDGKIDEGYATLTKGSKIAEKPVELQQLKAKTREAIEVFGNIVGYDFVESHSVGTRLVRATYISQGTVFPLRWRFYFYKPLDVWRLIDMRVDDKLTGLFDEPEDAKIPDLKNEDIDSPAK
jgi:hypothetical protein